MPEGERKKPRFKPGTVALRDIKKLQKGTDILFRKLPMQRLYRDVLKDLKPDARMMSSAVNDLNEIVQSYMISKYEAAYLCTIHAKRVTLMEKDLLLIQELGKYNL